jgi:uncharacterized protein (TIGR03905 family)
MVEFIYYPACVCSSQITLQLDGFILRKAEFSGGCDGNLHAICRLVEGMDARLVKERLAGIDCDGKGTSCPDQLAMAIDEYLRAKAQ